MTLIGANRESLKCNFLQKGVIAFSIVLMSNVATRMKRINHKQLRETVEQK